MIQFTLGMAVYDDFAGAWATIQYHRLTFPQLVREFLIVDNNPNGKEAEALKRFCAACGPTVRYIPLADPVGTAAPRNAIFDHATSDYVIVVDPHVMILPGGVEALAKWYDADPRSGDLVHGPMIYDDFVRFATHFNDQWRAEMWGTWGRAWLRPGDGLLVTPVESGNRVEWRELCQRATDGPDLPWSGHEAKLAQLGYQTPAEPFDIPGQGLGLFACRRDAWLRFNPLFRGFGGEEMYIHRKFRNAGRRTVCIPGLKWSHRFGRPGGAPYPLTVEDKSRNYVLGLTELGLPLDPARNLLAPRIGQDRWDRIVYKATGQQPAGPEPKTCAPRSGPSHREQLEARHRGRGALMAFRGIDAAIVNDFLIAHPEWVMMKESGGVTTLSRRPEDRKPLPSLTRQAINYAGAVAGHVAAGRPQASPELVKLRLDMCAICPERNGKRCSKCGCPVESKAKWAEQKCPLGKWPSE